MKKIVILFVLTFSAMTMNAMDQASTVFDELMQDIHAEPHSFAQDHPLIQFNERTWETSEMTSMVEHLNAQDCDSTDQVMAEPESDSLEQACETGSSHESDESADAAACTPTDSELSDEEEASAQSSDQEIEEAETSRKRKNAVAIDALAHTLEKRTKKYKCGNCHHVFPSQSTLTRHMVVHTGIKEFKCPHPGCHKEYTQRAHLNYHLRKNHSENPFGRKKRKCSMQAIQKIHEQTKRTHKKGLETISDTHKLIMSTPGKKCFKCKHCLYSTNIRSNLNRHLKNMHLEQ